MNPIVTFIWQSKLVTNFQMTPVNLNLLNSIPCRYRLEKLNGNKVTPVKSNEQTYSEYC